MFSLSINDIVSQTLVYRVEDKARDGLLAAAQHRLRPQLVGRRRMPNPRLWALRDDQPMAQDAGVRRVCGAAALEAHHGRLQGRGLCFRRGQGE